jgi:hypothetical protein
MCGMPIVRRSIGVSAPLTVSTTAKSTYLSSLSQKIEIIIPWPALWNCTRDCRKGASERSCPIIVIDLCNNPRFHHSHLYMGAQSSLSAIAALTALPEYGQLTYVRTADLALSCWSYNNHTPGSSPILLRSARAAMMLEQRVTLHGANAIASQRLNTMNVVIKYVLYACFSTSVPKTRCVLNPKHLYMRVEVGPPWRTCLIAQYKALVTY